MSANRKRALLITLVFSSCVLCCGIFFAQTADIGYDSDGKRDPFIPLVTQRVKVSSGLEGVQAVGDVVLEGIVWEPGGGSIAILNGVIVKEGNEIGSVRIEKIEEKLVIIYINEMKHEIALGEEGER